MENKPGKQEVRHEKSLVDRFIRRWDPHFHRQRLCVERVDAPDHGGRRRFPARRHLGVFRRHPVPRHVRRIPRQLRRAQRPEKKRSDFHAVLRRRYARHRFRHFPAEPCAALSLLRRHRRHRTRRRLHHAGFHTGQILPQESGIRYRHGHHGLRLCRADRRSCHAVSGGDLRPHLRLRHPRRRLHGRHGRLRPVSEPRKNTRSPCLPWKATPRRTPFGPGSSPLFGGFSSSISPAASVFWLWPRPWRRKPAA